MMPNIQEKLGACYREQMCNNFISYADADDTKNLKAVAEYETKIKDNKERMEELLDRIEYSFGEYSETLNPFVLNYLSNLAHVATLIEKCLTTASDICALIKKWCNQDRAYPKKLWDETLAINMARGRVIEETKKLQRKKGELNHNLGRKEAIRDRTIQKREDTKQEKLLMDGKLDQVNLTSFYIWGPDLIDMY